MNIKLIETFEVDGNWIKLLVDGNNIQCWKITTANRAEKLAEAEAAYEYAVKIAKENKEPITLKQFEL